MTQVIEVPEGAHSILGPSSAERWLNCPGSVLATKDMPDTPSSYALEGTAAHTLSEWVRLQRKPAKHWLGKVIRVTRGEQFWDIPVDEPMVDSVQEFCDRVAEQPGEELVEARVEYDCYVPGGFGTLDSAKLLPGVCRITDFKHGQGVKKYARDNPQLMLYAVGVLIAYDWLYDFEKFVLAISQPRLDFYDEWEVSLEELHDWVVFTVIDGAEAAMKVGAPFKAGAWCQFCRIKATCRTRMQSTFETAIGEFVDLDTAVQAAPKIAESVPLLSNDEIAKCLSAWPHIEKWGAALKDYAMRQVALGHPVGDMKLVAGRSARAWDAEPLAVEAALVAAGAKREDLYSPPELVTVARAEKLVPKKLFALGTDEKEAGPLAALVKKTEGKPTLVPGSDPRPALVVSPEVDFQDIEEGER